MIPDIARTGSSFKGALAYYLHDKKREGESERLSSDRVAWTETRNILTPDPELAGRIMAATAMDADRLKREAGVRNTGRKSAQSVYAYTLAWHPEEAKTLTRAEMVRAADETLRALGAEDRQAIFVCHTDRPHPHVHIILNRVSPQDGRMLVNSNDRLKLSQWALAYRQTRGQEQYCPQRAENWDMRLSRHKDRDRLKYWRAAADTPRSMMEDVHQAKAAGDPKVAQVIAAQKKRLAKLAADGQAMAARHATEWKALGARFKDRQAQILEQSKSGIDDAVTGIKAAYRPKWQDIGRRHSTERRRFLEREQRVSGKIKNAIEAVIHARDLNPESSRGFLGNAFNYLTSSKSRADMLERLHKAQVRELSASQRVDLGTAIRSIKSDRTALLASARGSFLSERAALIERQATDKQQLKGAWRRYGEDRKNAFAASRGLAQSAKESKAEREAEVDNKARTEFRSATEGRKPRAEGRGRRRKRKDE